MRALPPLRNWQELARRRWIDGRYRGIVKVVTGAGKTMFALSCAQHWRSRHPDAHIVVLVPTIALQDQWSLLLEDYLGLGGEGVSTHLRGGRIDSAAHATVLVLNSARDHDARDPGAENSLLIVDECHRAGSSANATALLPSYAATLGLSATPEGSYDERLAEALIPLIGPVIYEYGLAEALADRVIAPFALRNVRGWFSSAEQAEYDRLTRQLRRLPSASEDATSERAKTLLRLRARVSAEADCRVPIASSLAAQHMTERIIVFHEYIRFARAIAERIEKNGQRVCLYTSKESASHRRDNLRLFKSGYYDVLVTCRALD
jgi:superfamily II DNA or RNA helicase